MGRRDWEQETEDDDVDDRRLRGRKPGKDKRARRALARGYVDPRQRDDDRQEDRS